MLPKLVGVEPDSLIQGWTNLILICELLVRVSLVDYLEDACVKYFLLATFP